MNTKEISKKETLDWPFMPDFPSLRDWFEDFAPERLAWINSSHHAIRVEELNGTTEKGVKATYKDGILEVHVPTPELTEMPKRIPIHKM